MNRHAVFVLSLHTFNNDMIVKKIQTTYFELKNKIVKLASFHINCFYHRLNFRTTVLDKITVIL